MSRAAILARIRNATGVPTPPMPASHTAPASLTSSGAEAVTRFRATSKAKGVTVVDVDQPATLPLAIARTLSSANLRADTIRVNDPAVSELPWNAASLAIARGAAQPQDALTLSNALAAVAETGSLVLASGPDNPTGLAFLPETHLVTVARANIVGTFDDALAILSARYANNLPRAINIISGASRTGDIGGRIVHGAHGPRHVFVFIV
jgi:L-lactate dehydrogenase complex protein LldG